MPIRREREGGGGRSKDDTSGIKCEQKKRGAIGNECVSVYVPWYWNGFSAKRIETKN